MHRLQEFLDNLPASITFAERAAPVYGEYRPRWRISILLMSLKRCCYGGKSSIRRLHVLNWAVRTETSRQKLLEAVNGNISPDDVIIRYEPSVNLAIDLAVGFEAVSWWRPNRIKLTEQGERVAEGLFDEKAVFEMEAEFFDRLGYQLTEQRVKDLTEVLDR